MGSRNNGKWKKLDLWRKRITVYSIRFFDFNERFPFQKLESNRRNFSSISLLCGLYKRVIGWLWHLLAAWLFIWLQTCNTCFIWYMSTGGKMDQQKFFLFNVFLTTTLLTLLLLSKFERLAWIHWLQELFTIVFAQFTSFAASKCASW